MSQQSSPPVALITGAAKRIGRYLAISLHQQGYRIVVHCNQSIDEGKHLVNQLNALKANSAVLVTAELMKVENIERLAKDSLSCFGKIDLLINNASSFFPTPVGKVSQTEWQVLMGSNVKGPFFLIQGLLPSLRANNGQVINMIDMHIDRPLPNHSVYCMAKSALANLTTSLATELAPQIRVNGIAPGAILWPDRPMDNGQKQRLIDSIPLGEMGSEQDIQHAVNYLLKAHYVTGQILYVDGGRSLVPNAKDC